MKIYFICIALAACLVPGAEIYADDFYVDNVVIVLDGSGSMDSKMVKSGMKKMEAAKNALKEVAGRLPDTTHVGLVVFSAKGVSSDWIYPLGSIDRARLMTAISSPSPGGGTPLGEYIKKGADVLLAARERQHGYGTYRLLIVTDGEASDRELVNRYTPDVIARGITVDVIGVDMAESHTLATKVHSYRRADDPASLTQAVAEVFAEVSNTGSGDTAEDAFELIKSLPDELAAGMIAALASSGNHPIGTKPPEKKSVPLVRKSDTAAGPSAAVPGKAAPNPPAAKSKKGCGGGVMIWGILFLCLLGKAVLPKSGRS